MNQTIVNLNDFDKAKFNVLIPVTSLQAMSSLQRVIVNQVEIDTNLDKDKKSKDIYYEKLSSKYALTKIGLMKLAAAANIGIIESKSVTPDVCSKCVEMAKAVGKAQSCGNCPHAHDVKFTVTIRVPEPSGGFRLISDSKEIDCSIEKSSMSEAQYKQWLPHRASIAETKAFNRCIRSALTLAASYSIEELKKPFVIAHIVPNLDAPEIKNAIAASYLKNAGFLFESTGNQTEAGALPEAQANTQAALPAPADIADDNVGSDYINESDDIPEEFDGELPWNSSDIPDNGIYCTNCGQEILETKSKNGNPWTPEAIRGFSEKTFGRCLCTDCQQKVHKGANKYA